jgi:hypothetical protein
MATAPRTRSNLQIENVDDANHGQGRDGGSAVERDDDGIDDELSAEERDALAAMQSGERDAAGPEEPGDQRDGGADDADGDADPDGVDDDAAAARAGDRDQGARDNRGPKDDTAAQRPEPKTINYGRHQREINKREQRLRDLETQLNGEREQRTRLDERTKMLLDAINSAPKADQQQAAAEPVEQEPDQEQDPIGWNEWKIRSLEKVVQRLDGTIQKQQQRTDEQTEEDREVGEYTAELEAAARADDTVGAAFVHLRESRYVELGEVYAGIDVNDPEQCATLTPKQQLALTRQIQAAFANEQRMVYRAAKQTNRPIGRSIVALAKARGFNPAAAPRRDHVADQGQDRVQERAAPRGQGAPRAAPRAPVVPARTSVSDEIDNIQGGGGCIEIALGCGRLAWRFGRPGSAQRNGR